MRPTQALHEAGQSLWLDNITRALLDKGILARYVDEYSVTGLTFNPAIFDKAIKDGTAYDADIAARKAIPGTPEGLPAIEECICAAVPVNVTLLFSAEQYQAAAEAYLRGVERRIQADRNLTHLRQILGSRPVTLIPMPVTDPDLEAAAAVYASRLPDRFDLVHLGLGADGHTASLVPGDPVLEVTDWLVAVTGPYQGRGRMTLTYPALARAEEVMWLVTGASKHEALDRLLAGDRSIPAARVQARRSVIFADALAVHGSRPFQGAIFDVGVQAAKAGGMAALGVARLGDEQELADVGADLVVRTLDEVSRPALAEGRLARKMEG